jgi:UDP-glucose 4-epimerase
VSSCIVTGGAGFIGSHLCDRLLAEGHRVVAIDDLSSGRLEHIAEARAYGRQFTFYNVDIRTGGLPELLERHAPDVVYHLAARRDRADAADVLKGANVGVLGTLAVLEATVRCGARKLVFASGASVYGQVRTVPTKESSLPGSRPITPGAISKKLGEGYVRFYREARGLDSTSVVLADVYGPRRGEGGGASVVGAFARAMLTGARAEVFGDGEQTRDFLFVDDAVNALSLAADHGSGLSVNAGTGLETSINDLHRMLARIAGVRRAPARAPARTHDIRRRALDNRLASKELGWKPWTHLEDGLRETVAYLRDQRSGS